MEFKETSLEVVHIDEPNLEFKYCQKTDHPVDGLFLFGPAPATIRKDISVGVIGTKLGLRYFSRWATKLSKKIDLPPPTEREKKVRLHLSEFSGLEEVFGIRIFPEEFVEYNIDAKEIERTTSIENLHEAVTETVDLFIAAVEQHQKNEEKVVDVWVLVTPEVVHERCKSQAKRSNVPLSPGEFSKKQKKKASLPLLDSVLDTSSEDIFDDIPDFHRMVKAKFLHIGVASQIVRETTIAPEEFLNKAGKPKRGIQDPATIGWNFATGLFYKTQAAPPWKIADMRPGVCYIGLVFKILPNHPANHACCAAQMFLSEGDGVVFRGANGPWQTKKKEFHLDKAAAKALIKTVLDTYKLKFGDYPKELFIHGRTKFNYEEWEAFEEITPPGTNIVGVRISQTFGDMKLFRNGDYPCLRGTAILLDDKNAYLWASGYTPRLDTYIGPETPNPIRITILNSTKDAPDIKMVLRDILGLTKINYNACRYNDGLPVTIKFADKVGEVLVMGSAEGAERQPFKFYI